MTPASTDQSYGHGGVTHVSPNAGASDERPPVANAHSISKKFFATQALTDVSLSVASGEVVALIGENGAGKSTLIKIMGGVHQPDTGELRIDGTPITLRSPSEALAQGIVVIPQELNIVPSLSVAENVLLGQIPEKKRLGFIPVIDRPALHQQVTNLLGRMGVSFDSRTPAGDLGFAERQIIMIARALCHHARLLVLDEPTASLEAREVERLFEIIGRLKADGSGIVYISHRLDEVERIADRVVVLRDGRMVKTALQSEMGQEDMIRAMTGRDLDPKPSTGKRQKAERLFETDEIDINKGEIVGLAGLLGGGTGERLRVLFGADGEQEIKISGKKTVLRSPRDAVRAGLGFVPGERQHGLIMASTIRENIILPNIEIFAGRAGLNRAKINRVVKELIEAVNIRPADPNRPVRELSGGNQQKVIFARWLAGDPELLLLNEPTHGIDVGAKDQIHAVMRRFTESGGGILMASAEALEILSVSDRVIALRQGEIVARISRDEPEHFNERTLRNALGG